MNDSGKLTTSDGIELFWQSWQADVSRGAVVLIHGLADHSSRFTETGRFLARHGWSVYACDLRGHGLSSDGHQIGRVHVDHFHDYARDVSATIAHVKQRHPDIPVVILGHSMGGLVSLTYILDHPHELDGAVLSSPALATHPDAKPPAILTFVARIMARLKPRLLFSSDLKTGAVCRDPDVVRAYIDDPLVSKKVSAQWYVEITKAMEDIRGRAVELNIPTLLMQSGDDQMVDPKAAKQWAEKAPSGLLKLVVWDGLFHEMLNEPEKAKVQDCVLDWLTQNFPESGT